MKSYTYDEVRDASLKYFEGDTLAADVFASKYALQDLKGNIYELTPDEMHRRLAGEFGRIEKMYPNPMTTDEIHELFSSWKVVAQGGPMSAVGNPYQVQSLSNCFVIDAPYDSYAGIMKTDQEEVQIMKRRGGVGFDISTVRPKGLPAANAARTTDGIGVFMERFSNTCREVAQGGRRGALMLTISVHHPEVMTFCDIKRDRTKVTGANVSVRVTDEFMRAVKNGEMYQQRFPIDAPPGERLVERLVDAREVWKGIIAAMRDCSEPGVLFWDTVRSMGPADAYEKFGYGSVSTNPCLTYDTKIAVADGRGYVPIGQLAEEGRDVPVHCYENDTGKMIVRLMRNPRLTGKNVPVFKVTIEGGHTFKATGNHKMIMNDGTRKRVDELTNGDQLWVSTSDKNDNELKSSTSVSRSIKKKITHLDGRVQRDVLAANEQGYDVSVICNEAFVNRRCEQCSTSYKVKYSRREISFCSHSCSAAYEVKKDMRSKNGFSSWPSLKEAAALHNHRIVSVEPCGSEDVYNGTVDDVHNFCFGGWEIGKNEQLQVHSLNCGEITLSSYDSCRLLLVNLWKFVKDPFTSSARFDYDDFNDVVRKSQKLMDDLIDLELEAIDKILAKIASDPEPEDVKRTERELWEKIRSAAVNGRRTGLGITALGDAIAALNMKYGSDASVQFTNDVYRSLAVSSYRSSIEMARDRGTFPIFSWDVERGHPFIERVLNEDPELREMYDRYGRRNIANTTTAPAGSVSIMTQTTSGCEPVLFLKSRRKRKITTADKNARIDEVDALGDKWQYYDLFHPGLKKWMDVTGETDVALSPYHGSTVEEIDWLKKIDIQAAAQRWICHSISNTTNLPKDVSYETVEALCTHAWETGCKGVTIYRKGSRDAVIVDEATASGESSLTIVETNAPRRPKELECDIHRVSIKGEQYTVLVGLLNGRPYEVFAGLSEHIEVPKKTKKATLIKNGKKDGISTYNLSIPVGDDDSLLIKDVISMFDNPTYGAFTRTISLALRHGVPVQFLVEQLKKDKYSDMTSFNTIISRVLSKGYIKDGTVAAAEKTCPNCNGTTLVYQQGCVSCYGGTLPDGSSCTWSKC